MNPRVSRRAAVKTGIGLGIAATTALVAMGANRASASMASGSFDWTTGGATTAISVDAATTTSTTTGSLQSLINFNTANFNAEIGLIPQPGRGTAPPLGWKFLNGATNVPQLQLLYTFEPNENWKIAAYLVSSGNPSLISMGTAILQTMTTLQSKYHYHTPWKDESMLGLPIPYGNENVNPGFCFTASFGSPLPTMSNGQQYEIVQAAAVQTPGAPPVYRTPNLNTRSGTTVNAASLDEGLYQVANRYIRNDMTTANSLFSQATAMWDGLGFAGSGSPKSYRCMYLGMYLYVNKLI